MVQLVYYELRGHSCRELLRRSGSGSPHKILLFPEESWARNTKSTHWLLTECWWSKIKCNITEVTGSQRKHAKGIIQELGNGCICIHGSFKKDLEPDFRLTLTSEVTIADFSMGYSLTGILERGNLNKSILQPSHFVAVRRADVNAGFGQHQIHEACFKKCSLSTK